MNFDGGDWLAQPDDVALGDDMIFLCAEAATDDGQWTSVWSLDTTTDINFGNQASGGTSYVQGLQNGTEVLAATAPTTTLALHATANRIRIGTDPAETDHLDMNFYGLVVYEATAMSVPARRWMAEQCKIQLDEFA